MTIDASQLQRQPLPPTSVDITELSAQAKTILVVAQLRESLAILEDFGNRPPSMGSISEGSVPEQTLTDALRDALEVAAHIHSHVLELQTKVGRVD